MAQGILNQRKSVPHGWKNRVLHKDRGNLKKILRSGGKNQSQARSCGDGKKHQSSSRKGFFWSRTEDYEERRN